MNTVWCNAFQGSNCGAQQGPTLPQAVEGNRGQQPTLKNGDAQMNQNGDSEPRSRQAIAWRYSRDSTGTERLLARAHRRGGCFLQRYRQSGSCASDMQSPLLFNQNNWRLSMKYTKQIERVITPYHTGKMMIGCHYVNFRKQVMTRDGIRLQSALLAHKKPRNADKADRIVLICMVVIATCLPIAANLFNWKLGG